MPAGEAGRAVFWCFLDLRAQKGVEKIITAPLPSKEQSDLEASANAIRGVLGSLKA